MAPKTANKCCTDLFFLKAKTKTKHPVPTIPIATTSKILFTSLANPWIVKLNVSKIFNGGISE